MMFEGSKVLKRALSALLAVSLLAMPAAAQEGVAPVAAVSEVALVPLRATATAIGASVAWDDASQSATVTYGDIVAAFQVDQQQASVNGNAVEMAAPAQLREGRLQVPGQTLYEVFGMQFQADGSVDVPATEAVAFMKAFVAGKAESFITKFTPELQRVITPAYLQSGAGAMAGFGAMKQVMVVGHTRTSLHDSVEMLAAFEVLPVQATVRFTHTGAIDDFSMVPFSGGSVPSPAPAYASPDAFSEQETIVDAGGFPLSATLTLPKGEGPFPAVVLVHGSGPHDRDETMGGIKMFRDLGEGLATKGIAVLRFEKRSYVHPQKATASPDYSAYEESVADALAAVALLAKTESIDAKQIYVAGHSQGGFLVPTILAQDTEGQIAGAIVMAGPNSFPKALADQFELLAGRGEMAPAQAAFMIQHMKLLMDPAFDPANPPEGWALGAPSFWASFHKPAADQAKTQTAPLLILQGERDFQVAPSEVESWQAALADRTNVAYKLYPKLNHFFGEGEGESSSYAEYMVPANVPAYVIEDIANWIGEQ